jgi:hypothetical protein
MLLWKHPKDKRLQDMRKLILPAPSGLVLDFPIPHTTYTQICSIYECGFGLNTGVYESYYENFNESFKGPAIFLGESYTDKNSLEMFCHELAHRIQHIYYGNEQEQIPNFGTNAQTMLGYELEACRLSYFVYKQYFATAIKLHHAGFRLYRRTAHYLQFVKDNWGLI